MSTYCLLCGGSIDKTTAAKEAELRIADLERVIGGHRTRLAEAEPDSFQARKIAREISAMESRRLRWIESLGKKAV